MFSLHRRAGMKADKDFELQYTDTLKKCVALIEEETRYEREQISLALRIGKEVDVLVTQVEDEDAIFKRLSRDIFRARGKAISPSKISEYRQLYLNFESMDEVSTKEATMMKDVTVGMLTEIASKDGRQGSKSKNLTSPELIMLRKVNRLLDRFEATLDDKQPDDNDLSEILEELKLIGGKSEAILNTMQNAGGRSQLDLFKRCN
jgi:hypothetical protein